MRDTIYAPRLYACIVRWKERVKLDQPRCCVHSNGGHDQLLHVQRRRIELEGRRAVGRICQALKGNNANDGRLVEYANLHVMVHNDLKARKGVCLTLVLRRTTYALCR